MEATQRNLAGILGTSEQSLRLWEKHRTKAMPGPADRLIRTLYSEYIGGDGQVRRTLERLCELDQLEHAQGSFRETNKHWRPRTSSAVVEEACM
jgi:hypothetical protein